MLLSPDYSHAQPSIPLQPTISKTSTEPSLWTEDDRKASFNSKPEASSRNPWKPLTQKAYFLIPTILASGGLIATLQVFLERSNRDSGILFASNINDLPLSRSFAYTYLPTVVSLIIGFAWTWIDLDVRRLQPFLQLSRKQGALGADSILLHYPFDFVALVPFRAIRQRHWPVFSASIAVVLIFWGLTPLQSSIFATQTVQRAAAVITASSTSYLSLHDQKTTLTGSYAQSVYNIAWLNETLQPFMTRNGMLATFGLVGESSDIQTSETWTAPTRFFSVDITCEEPTYTKTAHSTYLNSSNGCHYATYNMNLPTDIGSDEYSSLYVGYWYEESMDSYLEQYCPDRANRTFLVRWSRGEQNTTDGATSNDPLEGTTLWCSSFYYEQEVNATIAPPSMSVVEVVPTGPKLPLPATVINLTDFEWSMSEGYEVNPNQGSYPFSGWPSPYERLCPKFPELKWDDYLPNMASFALASYQRPVVDYLDPETLKGSYQAACRLLFARRMADILSPELGHDTQISGTRQYTTQAIVMVPVFVYVVEGILAATILSAVAILGLTMHTKNNLASEPANLASMMALSGSDSRLIQMMSGNDRATAAELESLCKETRFALTKKDLGPRITVHHVEEANQTPPTSQSRGSQPSKPILPPELSWYFGLGFLGLHVIIISLIAFVYIRAQNENGLPLLSSSIFINQLVENYIPVIIGATFEPIWTMLNRTLSMLQPYEQLRKGSAPPSRSITTDYGSLPPQAVFGRALKAGHISLTLVCLMSLMANLLSVSLSSLLYENTVAISTPLNFTVPYLFPINGSSLGNESLSRSSQASDHFYVAMSNLTANTPLPAWTDSEFFYLPFDLTGSPIATTEYRAITPAVGASLECFVLVETADNNFTSLFNGTSQPSSDGWAGIPDLNLTMLENGRPHCNISISPRALWKPQGSNSTAIENLIFLHPDSSGECGLSVFAGWGRSQNLVVSSQSAPLNASWTGCKSSISVQFREVIVDRNGFVKWSAPSAQEPHQEQFFEPNSSSLIGSVHTMFDPWAIGGAVLKTSTAWHSDEYPSDFYNYLMAVTMNSSMFLNPDLSPPSFESTTPLLRALYTKLFAIVLGTNIPKIVRPSWKPQTITGFSIMPETRIFMSKPMLCISLTILSIYSLVTVALYARRPWKILPRIPTTIASQIAFFAASRALNDLGETSAMSTTERNGYVERQGHRYGFGRFVGSDGRVHVGIEREPFVQILRKQDMDADQKKQDSANSKEVGHWFKRRWH